MITMFLLLLLPSPSSSSSSSLSSSSCSPPPSPSLSDIWSVRPNVPFRSGKAWITGTHTPVQRIFHAQETATYRKQKTTSSLNSVPPTVGSRQTLTRNHTAFHQLWRAKSFNPRMPPKAGKVCRSMATRPDHGHSFPGRCPSGLQLFLRSSHLRAWGLKLLVIWGMGC